METMEDYRFCENLVQLRKKSNISQEQLAQMLNVTRQAVSKWESGQSMPDVEKLVSMSRFFGVTTDQLIFGGKAPEKKKSGFRWIGILVFGFLVVMWCTGLVIAMFAMFANGGQTFDSGVWTWALEMMMDAQKYIVWLVGILLVLELLPRLQPHFRRLLRSLKNRSPKA